MNCDVCNSEISGSYQWDEDLGIMCGACAGFNGHEEEYDEDQVNIMEELTEHGG